ncbi:hypothetical protein D3C84_1275420 [compost metagenome]
MAFPEFSGGHQCARRCVEPVWLMSGADDVVAEATMTIFNAGDCAVDVFQAKGGVFEE